MLTPSTLRATTASKVALRWETIVWRAWVKENVLPHSTHRIDDVSRTWFGRIVANDVSGTDFAPQRTDAIETSAIFHFGSALTRENCVLEILATNSSTQGGWGLPQHLVAEAPENLFIIEG